MNPTITPNMNPKLVARGCGSGRVGTPQIIVAFRHETTGSFDTVDGWKPFYTHNENLYPALNTLKRKRTIEAVDQMLAIAIKEEHDIAVEYGLNLKESECYYENTLTCRESVINSLFYISDRWNCVGRLKYLKRVIELY